MAKNAYLQQKAAREQLVFDTGIRIGRQQMCDYITLALRNPEIMGKDTFGGKRVISVLKEVNRLVNQFQPAFDQCDEADYWQEKLDAMLREAYGNELDEGFFSFHDRYEVVKRFDYKKGKWV